MPLALSGLLGYLSYIAHTHLSRDSTVYSWLGPLLSIIKQDNSPEANQMEAGLQVALPPW